MRLERLTGRGFDPFAADEETLGLADQKRMTTDTVEVAFTGTLGSFRLDTAFTVPTTGVT